MIEKYIIYRGLKKGRVVVVILYRKVVVVVYLLFQENYSKLQNLQFAQFKPVFCSIKPSHQVYCGRVKKKPRRIHASLGLPRDDTSKDTDPS